MKSTAYVVCFERGSYMDTSFANVASWVCGSELFLRQEDAETCCAADRLRNPSIKHAVIKVQFDVLN